MVWLSYNDDAPSLAMGSLVWLMNWIPWFPCRFKWFWFLATGTFGGLADMSYNYNAAVSFSVPYLSTDGERCSLQNCLSSTSLFIFLTPPPDFRIWLLVNSL